MFSLQWFGTVGWASGLLKVGCWFVDDDDSIGLELCTSYSSSCHHTSIILSSNNAQNGDILILVNQGGSGVVVFNVPLDTV